MTKRIRVNIEINQCKYHLWLMVHKLGICRIDDMLFGVEDDNQ